MRKDELVHLHSLLAVLRAEYERRGAPAEAFADYDDLDVSPMAVYGSKGEHTRAVQRLASALAAISEERSDDSQERDAAVDEPNVAAQS